jgi:hypothetical protein
VQKNKKFLVEIIGNKKRVPPGKAGLFLTIKKDVLWDRRNEIRAATALIKS